MAFREDLIKMYYLVNLQRYTGDVVKGKENQLFLSPLIIPNKEKYIKIVNDYTIVEDSINKIRKSIKDIQEKIPRFNA